MKKTLLSLVTGVLVAGSAIAQTSGVTVSPLGATPNDMITITVDPAQVCTPAGKQPIAGQPVIRLHAGVTTGGSRWQSVVDAGSSDNSIVGFTMRPDGKFQKSFVPAQYFNLPTGTDATELCFVMNAGPDGGDRWANEGKFTDPVTSECGDFFVPFPVVAPFGVASVKKAASSFTIGSAQPNPFSGSTTIRYTMKRAEKVTVRVSNLLGETVATLVDGKVGVGAQAATWNAGNATPGIYFFTVETAAGRETRKMQLVR